MSNAVSETALDMNGSAFHQGLSQHTSRDEDTTRQDETPMDGGHWNKNSVTSCHGLSARCAHYLEKHSDRDRTWNLLQLPQEIILHILYYLPPSALSACIHVHPTFRTLITDPCFLDTMTRTTLGFSDSKDRDISYSLLAQLMPASPQMELEFFTFNAAMHTCDTYRCAMTQYSVFFPVELRRHALLTWLTQSMHNDNNRWSCCNYSAWYRRHKLYTDINNLPGFVRRPLTRLTMAWPDLIERTMLATHLSLHRGKPETLSSVWARGLTPALQDKIRPEYCLEIICGEEEQSDAFLSAMLVCFSPEVWLVWSGIITHYPRCNYKGTTRLIVMDTDSDIGTVRRKCQNICEHVYSSEVKNYQWQLQMHFPGACYRHHHYSRGKLVASVSSLMEVLTNRTVSSTKLSPCGQEHSEFFILRRHRKYSASFPKEFCLSTPCSQSDFFLFLLDDQMGSILMDDSLLEEVFHGLIAWAFSEAFRYACDPDCHLILCDTCSKLWFPRKKSLSTCIDRIMYQKYVPFDMWPYHLLLMLNTVLNKI